MFGAFETLYATSVPAAQLGSALSLFLAVFAVVTFYLAIASLCTDLVLAVILWLIFVGLALLSIGAGASMSGVTKAGGWVVLVFAAWPGTTPPGTSSPPPSAARSCPSGRRRSGRAAPPGESGAAEAHDTSRAACSASNSSSVGSTSSRRCGRQRFPR